MNNKLVITEKPSVAASIAAVINAKTKKDGYFEGSGYIVSWCIGHLVEPAQVSINNKQYEKWDLNNLPILPDRWEYEVPKDKHKQFNTLCSLMKRDDVDSLICATDAGREGELIFRLVYEKSGCKKPFERLWVSSMEDTAIKAGFGSLKPGTDYDNLYQSALCRMKADWLVGINATRLFSVLYNATLTVGRVQSPTLAMLTRRYNEINDFKPEPYYHVHINPSGIIAAGEKLSDREKAEEIKAACNNQTAVLASCFKENKTINPPKLYDLTTLQREANSIYGYTAQQTLDYTQSLYEKKLVTYPRTDSQYITADMAGAAKKVAAGIINVIPFAKNISAERDISKVINDNKVTDHHAIIPTLEIEKSSLQAVPEAEKNILYLICAKLLCAVAAPHTYESIKAVFDCAGYTFEAKGATVLQQGWKEVGQAFKSSLKQKPKEEKEDIKTLPFMEPGKRFESMESSISEHTTTPPKQYTEDTLLSAMERAGNEDANPDAEKKGLGTPATRAGVIEKLVQKGFVLRDKQKLIPTEKGLKLITVLPENLTSPRLTSEWENSLTQIAKGTCLAENFISGIKQLTRALIRENPAIPEENRSIFAKPSIGNCPRCNGGVHEGQKNFYCGNRECGFSMWKNDRFFTDKKVKFTVKIAEKLLKDGKVPISSLYSKYTDKYYDAIVCLADTNGKYVNYKLEFDKK